MTRLTKTEKIFWLIIVSGAALRFIGIQYGLPAVFNADEPHVVNIAVSFGAGTLNPHYFKYPTLYMYVLFVSYGIFYILWSGVGLLHSTRQFAALFVWNPTSFYLIARVLSAIFSIAAVYPVFLAGQLLAPPTDDESNERAGLWAAAFLAASPIVIASAHAAKPESLMLFLSAWAWYFGVCHRIHGRAGDLLKCGFLAGLSCSAQYTALPALILVPVAWAMWRSSGIGVLAGTLGASAVGFLAGCPFALLNYPAFFGMIKDMRSMQGMVAGRFAAMWPQVTWNVATFAGPGWLGIPFLVLGLIVLLRRDKKSAILLLVPALALMGCLSFSGEGGWQRYLFAIFPALALSAGVGVEWIIAYARKKLGKRFLNESIAQAALAAILMIPGGLDCWRFDSELLLPDTRTLAAQWIEKHVPQGSKILMDQEHASPPLRLSRETAESLFERTKALGHPKARYYEIMKDSHPGGGYAVYQVLRSAQDLWTLPGYAAESAMGRPVLDVSKGLAAVRKERISWVILTSFGATLEHSHELQRFLLETEREGKLQAEFTPDPGGKTGPRIRVYRIS